MSKIPSNRVASLATLIAGLAGLGTALAGVWPSPATTKIAAAAGAFATIAGPLSHVIGSWFWDRTPAAQAAAMAKVNSSQITTDPPELPPSCQWINDAETGAGVEEENFDEPHELMGAESDDVIDADQWQKNRAEIIDSPPIVVSPHADEIENMPKDTPESSK